MTFGLRKQYCYCKCYFEQNLYLKEYNMHFVYKNSAQFRKDYSQILRSNDQNKIKTIEEQLLNEIKRRKKNVSELSQRSKFIGQNYKYLHPSLTSFSETYFDPSFMKLHTYASENESPIQSKALLTKHKERIYSFQVFTSTFCDKLIEEVKHFEMSSIPKQRPNTMNKYGVNIDEIGFEPFMSEFRSKYLSPITAELFPDWGGGSLDSHKAFIVHYKDDADVDLGYHYDNAEVTLNVSLNDSFNDGEIYFGPMRYDYDSSLRFGLAHKKGKGILHRGQQMHGALPITEGERYNLIIWMRSSDVRNQLCPMCDSLPNLELTDHGFGDGFTMTVHDICLLS